MPATIRKDLYEDLYKARAKAWMIHGSCEAIDLAQGDYKPDAVWFEGTKIVCEEIAETVSEVFCVLEPKKAPETTDAETSEED